MYAYSVQQTSSTLGSRHIVDRRSPVAIAQTLFPLLILPGFAYRGRYAICAPAFPDLYTYSKGATQKSWVLGNRILTLTTSAIFSAQNGSTEK